MIQQIDGTPIGDPIITLFQSIVGLMATYGADALVVFVTVALCMGLRYILPGPNDPTTGKRTWEATATLERFIPFAAFIIGMLLELLLDTFKGTERFCIAAIRGGLSTGAWALALERIIFKTIKGKT